MKTCCSTTFLRPGFGRDRSGPSRRCYACLKAVPLVYLPERFRPGYKRRDLDGMPLPSQGGYEPDALDNMAGSVRAACQRLATTDTFVRRARWALHEEENQQCA